MKDSKRSPRPPLSSGRSGSGFLGSTSGSSHGMGAGGAGGGREPECFSPEFVGFAGERRREGSGANNLRGSKSVASTPSGRSGTAMGSFSRCGVVLSFVVVVVVPRVFAQHLSTVSISISIYLSIYPYLPSSRNETRVVSCPIGPTNKQTHTHVSGVGSSSVSRVVRSIFRTTWCSVSRSGPTRQREPTSTVIDRLMGLSHPSSSEGKK